MCCFFISYNVYFFSSVWINKGGTGKTTLTFQLSAAYADKHQKNIRDIKYAHVVVIDLCPRADVSDILLKTYGTSKADSEEFKIDVIELNGKTYNKTVSGYLSARLDKHSIKDFGVERFLTQVGKTNRHIPFNLYLLRGCVILDELSKRLQQERQCPWTCVRVIT